MWLELTGQDQGKRRRLFLLLNLVKYSHSSRLQFLCAITFSSTEVDIPLRLDEFRYVVFRTYAL